MTPDSRRDAAARRACRRGADAALRRRSWSRKEEPRRDSFANQSGATAIGADENGDGSGARATGQASTALGSDAYASTTRSTALGSAAQATAVDATAVGQSARAIGGRSTALGVDAGLHPNPRAKGDNHISGSVGAYRGQAAFAAGYFRHLGDQTMFSVGASTTGNDWSANAGFTFSW